MIVLQNTPPKCLLHLNTSHNTSLQFLLNSSSQYSYKCLLHVITSHIFLYNTSQYISTILQNISPQYFTMLHNTLQFFSTKSLLITSPQRPLYNNTFLHLVISNNANYVHQYNPSDHRLNYAASLDSYTVFTSIERLLLLFYQHAQVNITHQRFHHLSGVTDELFVSNIYVNVSNRERDNSLSAQWSHTHTAVSSPCSLTQSVSRF